MKPARLAVLGVAIVAGGAAALMMSGGEPPPPPPSSQAPASGSTPSTCWSLRRISRWGRTSRRPTALAAGRPTARRARSSRRSDAPNGLEETAGSIARSRPLRRRADPAREADQGRRRGFMSAILPAGMRAVAISIDTRGANSAGGFILPNDRVDVIRTFRDDESSRAGGVDVHVSETILPNIRVLAIGQNIQERNGEKVVTGETATLELTPGQAEIDHRWRRRSASSRWPCAASRTPTRPGRAALAKRAETALTVVRYGVSKQSRSVKRPFSARRAARWDRPAAHGYDRIGLLVARLCAGASCAGVRWRQRSARDVGPNGRPLRRRSSRSARRAAIARRIDLSIGRSLIVDLPRDAKEVFVANPKVANAVVRSTRKIFVIGMTNGATTIFVMDADGRQIAALDINGRPRPQRACARPSGRAMPRRGSNIEPAGDSIVLTGTVASAEPRRSRRWTSPRPSSASPAACRQRRRSGAVINSLDDPRQGPGDAAASPWSRSPRTRAQAVRHQHVGGSWSALRLPHRHALPALAPGRSRSIDRSAARSAAAATSPNATLRAFERAGVSRVLAEPTLTAISGESREVHRGRRNPDPESAELRHAIGGWPATCTIGVELQALRRHPELHAGGAVRGPDQPAGLHRGDRSRLREPDPASSTAQRAGLQGAQDRRPRSSCPPAPSMMTAGLIAADAAARRSTACPGLMNLPVLGALFRSRDYQRKETELMIMVTPYIAKPMEAGRGRRGRTTASSRLTTPRPCCSAA